MLKSNLQFITFQSVCVLENTLMQATNQCILFWGSINTHRTQMQTNMVNKSQTSYASALNLFIYICKRLDSSNIHRNTTSITYVNPSFNTIHSFFLVMYMYMEHKLKTTMKVIWPICLYQSHGGCHRSCIKPTY